jgi:hypothetical protein
MTLAGQSRSFGGVGSMSGLPESGQGWSIYEYTPFLLLQLRTMAASVSAHLLLQDALAAALGAEALPVAVDAKLFTALRIGTGAELRLGS